MVAQGWTAVPIMFRRPIARVNVVPLEYLPTWNENIFIPPKLWLIKEHRFMTFRKIFESVVRRFVEIEQYGRIGADFLRQNHDLLG